MQLVELMTVEETFCMTVPQDGASMLILAPDFSVPDKVWKDRIETVIIAKPCGEQMEGITRFCLSHYNIRDVNVSMDRRWRITLIVEDKTKADIPVGSKILASHEIAEALLSK